MSPPPAKKAKTNGNNFSRNNKKVLVQNGQRGFLATCNYQEKGCVRECFNILAHYANFVYGADCEIPQSDEVKDMAELKVDDISDELQREINVVQQQSYKPNKARFLALDTGALNTVFIRTSLQDPVQLGYFIVRDIFNTKSQRTRSLIRLIPIEVVCTAGNVQAIVNAVGPLFDSYFVTEPCSYSIVVNRRLNNTIDRDIIIRELAALVRTKNPENSVDLRNPAKTIVVEIIKGTCMIGVLPLYFKYKKYNLIECSRPENTDGGGFENVSAPAIMQSLPLSPKIEESPASPVEGGAIEEIAEEPMEGPIEESSEISESMDEAIEDEPEKSLTDSPDSPQDEVKDEQKEEPDAAAAVETTPTANNPPEPKAAAEEVVEEEEEEVAEEEKAEKVPEKLDNDQTLNKTDDDEPISIENGDDNNNKQEDKVDNAEEAKIPIEIKNADEKVVNDEKTEETMPDDKKEYVAGEEVKADNIN